MEIVENLKKIAKGRVIGPKDADYDKIRLVFMGGIDKHPAAIVRVADAEDVSKVILFAKEHRLELAVRSGGHSGAGHSTTEKGIVLDLREMKKFEINEKDKTAWAETGLTAVEFGLKADKHNLTLGFGDTGSVGIGGITLGGGIGLLVRKFGLTIDNVLAAEIVTADGKILDVSEISHPALFWAIKGGGGNFGVVTKFKYQLHDIGDVLGGMLFLPATSEVIAKFIALSKNAPEELSTIANIMPAPPMPFLPKELTGKLIIMAMMIYAGDPKKGEEVIAPFRTIEKPLADMIKKMRYPEIFTPLEESYHPKAVGHTMFMNSVDDTNAKIMMEELEASDASMRVVQLRIISGAMSRVNPDSTAFAHRKSNLMVNIAAFYEDANDKEVKRKWVEGLYEKLDQGDTGMYVNFLESDGAKHIHQAYPGNTWDRLVEIKRKYDPKNFFNLNHNISTEK